MSEPDAADAQSLEAVGIGRTEQRVYEELLDRPGASVAEIAPAAEVAPAEARRAVRTLQALGMVSRTATRPHRFVPAAPNAAVDVLILARQEELERARLAAARLTERYRVAAEQRRTVDEVEVITGREAIAQQFLQLQRAVQHQVLGFDLPPYTTEGDTLNQAELDALGRGVGYRIIYDTSAMEVPGQVDALRTMVGAGEQARTLAGLPVKLAIFDGRAGLIPVTMTGNGTPEAVLVHASALLDALVMLFETLWNRAVPLPIDGHPGQPAGTDTSALPATDQAVLALLSAGLKDRAIARQLGIGVSTLERRIKHLIAQLQAQTRFQAGVMASQRGWLTPTKAADQP